MQAHTVLAPTSNFVTWLSLQGCEEQDATSAADATQPPPLISLIRSSGEQQLLRTIGESAAQLDELVSAIEVEGIRARWKARINKSRTTHAESTEKESRDKPTSALTSLFEKVAGTIESLRSTSLPSLQSSAHLNHLLSGELEAEGCAPLAASKKRVAQAEEALTRRITALLEGKLTVDEAAIRQQYEAASSRLIPAVTADASLLPNSFATDCTNISPVKAVTSKRDHEPKEDSSDHTSSSSSSIPLGQPEPSMNQTSLSLHASTPPSSAASSSSSSASAIVEQNSPLILAAQSSQPAAIHLKPTSPARHSGSQQLRSPTSSQKQSSAADAGFVSTPPQTNGGLASLVDLQTPLHSRTVAVQSPVSGNSKVDGLIASSAQSTPATPAAVAAPLTASGAVCGCTPSIEGVHSCKLRSPPMRTPSQVRNDANQSANASATKQNNDSSANASLTSQINSIFPSQPMSCSQPGAPDNKSRDDSSASLVLSFAPGNSLGAASQSQAMLMGEDVEQEPLVLSLNNQMSQQLQSSQGNYLIRSQFARPSQAMSMLSPVLDEDVMADADMSSSSASRRSPVYDADVENNEEKDPSQASEEAAISQAKILSVPPQQLSEEKCENYAEEHPPFAAPNLFDNDLPFPQSAPAPSSTVTAKVISATASSPMVFPSRSASQQLASPPPCSKKSYQSPVKISHTQVADQDDSSQAGGGSGSGWKKKRKLTEAPTAASSQVVPSTTSPLRTSERAKKLVKH